MVVMSKSSIKFLNANPTLDEGRVYARYLDQAAEGFFHFMLGRRSTDIIATSFTHPGHDLSYQNVTFAECEKIIVGMVSAYTAEQHRRSTDQPLKQAAGKFNLRMMVVKTLFAPLFRIIDTIADSDFYIQAMAVGIIELISKTWAEKYTTVLRESWLSEGYKKRLNCVSARVL